MAVAELGTRGNMARADPTNFFFIGPTVFLAYFHCLFPSLTTVQDMS